MILHRSLKEDNKLASGEIPINHKICKECSSSELLIWEYKNVYGIWRSTHYDDSLSKTRRGIEILRAWGHHTMVYIDLKFNKRRALTHTHKNKWNVYEAIQE
jgi:hypothetical protein